MRVLTPTTTNNNRYSLNMYWFLYEAFPVIQTSALCHIICHLIIGYYVIDQKKVPNDFQLVYFSDTENFQET